MVRGKKRDGTLGIGGQRVSVRCHQATGRLTAEANGRAFAVADRLREPAAAARVVGVRDALGDGKAIEVGHPSRSVTRLALYETLPFLCVTTSVRNETDEPMTVAELTPLAAELDVGAPASELRVLGSDGPHAATGRRTSYAFMALAHRETRAGMVCGWLTHERASGIVRFDGRGERPTVRGVAEYGRLLVAPGETAMGETFAIGWFDDVLDGLEQFADAVAKANRIRLPKTVPSGYCTWYHAGPSDQERTAEIAGFCAGELADYGLEFVQIDDGWQIGRRDFTAHKPDGPYSNGMQPTAEAITSGGCTAGIWLIPFGWDPECRALADHPEWFVHRRDGSIYGVHWAGSCLDMTHPEARRLLRGVVERMVRAWGYRYLKIDGLWSGMATKILYPKPHYRKDDLGGAVLHDPRKTQIEAYRDGLRLVRRAAGKDTFILGCCIAQNMRTMGASIGLVDGMRIGPDIGAHWDGIVRCARAASQLYFWNRRVWFNDPDCLMLREPLTLDQARAWGSLIVLSGQMNVVSEWLPGLPAERLDVLKRTMPNPGLDGRPLDLLERSLPRIWHARVGKGEAAQHLVGLFNWDAKRRARIHLDLTRLSLSAVEQVVGFDYWEDAFIEPFAGERTFTLRPGSCRVLSLRRMGDRPQLVSTSRHVSQGAVDVRKLRWSARQRALSGVSRAIGGEPYELRLWAGAARVASLRAPDGLETAWEQDGPQVRVRLLSAATGDAAWRIVFSG